MIKSLHTTILCVAFLMTATITSAHADYFVWQDPKSGASITYPDTWRMINNQKPDDRVTLLGPSGLDRPTCRLRTRSDKRWLYYPTEFSQDVQHFAYDQDFWLDYTGEYNNVSFSLVKNDAGLGHAFASMAVINFTDATPRNDKIIRMGQMWAGVYHDTAYILDCSATKASFREWQPDFAAIAKSVQLVPVMTQTPQQYYREPFLHPKYIDNLRATGAPDEVMGQTR